MINLVYVPLSIQYSQPYVLLPLSLLSRDGFLLGSQLNFLSVIEPPPELNIVHLNWSISYRVVQHVITLLCLDNGTNHFLNQYIYLLKWMHTVFKGMINAAK